MTREDLRQLLALSPLIASVQASAGTSVDTPETLAQMAKDSLAQGVKVLRLQGIDNIRAIKSATHAPVIGLIKKDYPGSDVYITPTLVEVKALLAEGCEIIALDGTPRTRPGSLGLQELIAAIHAGGAMAMADCYSLESAEQALQAGADWIGTTLAGYTSARAASQGPDIERLRELVALAPGRVIAEGRYSEPWEAQAAIAIGAEAVVIGGALNDPTKQTRRFATAIEPSQEPVGAVDIGGTWLRFALVAPERKILRVERINLLADPLERLNWIETQAREHGVTRLGIGTGGTIDPQTRTVTEAKAIIPDHVGTRFQFDAIQTIALNDGLATAWGHGCHPDFAGRRVATLALGTGVGCGLVDRGRIWMGPNGEYPRINDLPCSLGGTIEDHLGGIGLGPEASPQQRHHAQIAANEALHAIQNLYHPDEVIVCGAVGLADWLHLPGTRPSPYRENAGILGAASLALFPPVQVS